VTRLSWVIWKNGPENAWPLLSLAIIVPRVEPVSLQLKVALRPPPADWPVPKPVVVQAVAAIAKSDAPAVLMQNGVMTLLLSRRKRFRRGRGSDH
jgi:hypothetical protein